MCRHGCPEVLITDQGTEFVNEVSGELCSVTHTEHRGLPVLTIPRLDGIIIFNSINFNLAYKFVYTHCRPMV